MGEYEGVLTDPQARFEAENQRTLQLVLRFLIGYAYAKD
jgi:hypothetical protein